MELFTTATFSNNIFHCNLHVYTEMGQLALISPVKNALIVYHVTNYKTSHSLLHKSASVTVESAKHQNWQYLVTPLNSVIFFVLNSDHRIFQFQFLCLW
jgi:hypothetical protein